MGRRGLVGLRLKLLQSLGIFRAHDFDVLTTAQEDGASQSVYDSCWIRSEAIPTIHGRHVKWLTAFLRRNAGEMLSTNFGEGLVLYACSSDNHTRTHVVRLDKIRKLLTADTF